MLTKHDERKMPKNLGHIESLARSYTRTAIKTLAGIMMEQTSPPMARIVAAKVLLARGWGTPKESHHSEFADNKTLLKGVNEIVHVHETREQIELRDQTAAARTHPRGYRRQWVEKFALKATTSSSSAPRPSFSRYWRRRA